MFHQLYDFWHERGERESYVGTLVNAWLAAGNQAVALRAGTRYVDVGTLHGYREAIRLLADTDLDDSAISHNIPLQRA